MKRFFLATVPALAGAMAMNAANAADLPTKAPVYKAQPIAIYNWTGFYLGVNAGVAVSQTNASTPDLRGVEGSVDRGAAGFAGGVQGGYNWQFARQWLAGFEGDIGYLGINRSFTDFNENRAFGFKTNWYATLRGRLGYTAGPSLFYATGGAAFVNVKNNYDLPNITPAVLASKSETAAGWTVGGGTESMLGGNWSAKAEYLYIHAGSQNVLNPLTREVAEFDSRFHVFRYGLNYKFGEPAVSAGAMPEHDWNGFYVGMNGGVGLAQNAVDTTLARRPRGTAVDIVDPAFAGGMQAGYNWQFAPHWVAGLEGDIGYLGIDRSLENWDETDIFFGVKADWYGTLRGRLGYSTGPALLYVTGGAAFVKVKNNFDGDAVLASKSETARGWAMGGGIEAALTQNWTAKTEYLYINAGSQDVFNPDVAGRPETAHFDNRFHVFRYGLNYKFGGL